MSTHGHRGASATATTILFAALVAGTPVIAGCAGTATQESTGEYIDDSVITARVKLALADDPRVTASDIGVETFKGRVQLSGFIEAEQDRHVALALTRGVPGVLQVVDGLVVR